MIRLIPKIMCTAALTAVLAIPSFAASTKSIDMDATEMSIDESTCAAYSLEFVEAYYNERYGTTDTDGVFSCDVLYESDTVETYILQKSFYDNTTKRYGEEYNNYSGEFTVVDTQYTDGKIYCKVICEKTFTYKGRSSASASGCHVYLTFTKNDENQWVISDMYEKESADINLRGLYSFEQYIASDTSVTESLLESLSEKITSYDTYIASCYEPDTETVETSNTVSSSVLLETSPCLLASVRASGTFDRLEMVYYAIANAALDEPESGNSTYAEYVPFETLGTATNPSYDCTNFVSHVLLSGGAIPSSGWYFNSSSDRTASWSGVTSFYNFITTNSSNGPYGTEVPYTESISAQYDIGDIIQIDYSSTSYWDHSTVITGFDTNGTYIPLITSRSEAGSYNIDEKITDEYEDDDYRVIKLNGYRY